MHAPPTQPIILIDTMAVIGAKASRCWPAVAARHQIETGTVVLQEAQAGDKYAAGYVALTTEDVQRIKVIHTADESALDALRVDPRLSATGGLDAGELELIAIANAWSAEGHTNWLMCTHDRAAIRAMVELGLGDYLVSLEKLVGACGQNPRPDLKSHLKDRWLSTERTAARLARGSL